MKTILSIFLLLQTLASFSQTIKGKVYDNDSTIEDVKIENTSKSLSTYTDNDGAFEITAAIKDTLLFSSMFHEQQKVIIKMQQLNELNVFELKKITNTLEEVVLTDENKDKVFNQNELKADLSLQIQNDIENNPHLYGNLGSGSMDFIAIAKLIGKLFKNKNKPEPIVSINYYEINRLFETDPFFNTSLLEKTLGIESGYKYLFFEYLEAQNIDNKLLTKDNKFLLLDAFVTHSHIFKKIVLKFKSEKKPKTN